MDPGRKKKGDGSDRRGMLDVLEEAQEALASESDPEAILEALASAAARVVGAETLAVTMLSEDRTILRYEYTYGKHAEALLGAVFPIDNAGLCGWVLANRKPILSVDLLDDPRVIKEAAKAYGIHTALLTPLIARGEIIGGLSAFNKLDGSKFDEDDLFALSRISGYAALAVFNARLMRDVSREKTKLEAVLDNIPAGLVFISRDGVILETNRAARELLGLGEDIVGNNVRDMDRDNPVRTAAGWDAEAGPGRRCWEVMSCENEACDVYKADVLRCWSFSNGYCRVAEYEAPGREKLWEVCSGCKVLQDALGRLASRSELRLYGRTLGVSSTLVMERGEEGLFGELIVIDDITAGKELERQRADFISMLSHDLKTPISSIIGYCELAEQEEKIEAVREIGRVVHRNSARLLKMINDVLDFTKVESGRVDVEKSVFGLGSLFGPALEPYRPIALEKGVELSWGVAPGTRSVHADIDLLTRIIGNLVTNAIEQLGRGGKVEVSASDGPEGFVRVEVKDDGPGIEPNTKARMFEKYYTTKNGGLGGKGLGLAIVKALCDLQGGSVGVESEEGKGARFWVLMPAAPPKAA